MRRIGITTLSLFVTLVLTTRAAIAEEPKGEDPAQGKLVGTWKLVSAKYNGQDFRFPEGATMLKHITPTQFMWVTYDADGNVTRAASVLGMHRQSLQHKLRELGLGRRYVAVGGRDAGDT